MKHLVSCLALVAAFTSSLLSQNIEFEQLNGPYGGGSQILVGKPGFLYQIFANKVIYRSSDDGENWEKMPPTPVSIQFWPIVVGADGNVYCHNLDTIFKSIDNAKTWQSLVSIPSIPFKGIFALPNGTILAKGFYAEISRSADGGQTWTTIQNLDAKGGFACNSLNGDVFTWPKSVSAGTTGKMLRSSDNGQTWTVVLEDENCYGLDIAFAPNGTIFVGGVGLLWKSTDNCANWAPDNFSSLGITDKIDLAVSQTGRVFAFDGKYTFFSDDNGNTWQVPSDTGGVKSGFFRFIVSSNGKIFAKLSTISTYYSSSDDGKNWAFSSYGIPFIKVHKLIHIDDSNLLSLTDDGIWQSKNGGDSWTLAAVLGADDSKDGVLAASEAGTWYYYDGSDKIFKITYDGATQIELVTPVTNWNIVGLWKPKANNLLFLSTYDGLFTSEDEGQTWVLKNTNLFQYLIFMPDGSIIWNDLSNLLKSLDNGATWTVLSTNKFSILTLGENGTLYNANYTDHFSTSPDGGLTWELIPLDQNLTDIADQLTANNIGHIFLFSELFGTLYRSIDGGHTFSLITTNVDGISQSVISFDPSQRLFIATNFKGIYRSKLPTSDIKILSGTIFFDKNKNCDLDLPTDTTLTRRLVKATKGSQTVYGYVNAAGKYLLPMEPGDWTAEAIAPSDYWQSCTEAVNIPNAPTVGIVDSAAIGMKVLVDCPLANIEITAPFLRRCFESTLYAKFKNTGTAPAIDAKLTITLDPFLVFNSASLPVFSQNGQVFTFSLGTLDIGEFGTLTIKVTPDCAAPLGQIHCVSAHITPDVLCPPTFGAKVVTSATCASDSLHLLISNIGQTAIAAPLNWSISTQNMDNISSWATSEHGQFQLAAGETKAIALAADGSKIYTFTAQQSPNFPFNLISMTTIQGCGTGANLPFNIANVDDDGPFDDQLCQPNIGAFDPNDKQGFPIGIGEAGYIEREQKLEYLIRFQNTGSDTAFNASIRDTLPATLDPATLVLGPTSHPCRLQIMPDGSAMFLFEHIMLPDSNVNEAASHGFVRYSVAQKMGNPIGTKIQNRAGIYFDFNEPVLTNYTLHTVGIPMVTGTNELNFLEKSTIRLLPNPFNESTTLILAENIDHEAEFLFEMHDLMGRKVRSEMFTGTQKTVLRGNLPTGLYQFSVKTLGGAVVGSGKVSIQ